MGCSGCPYVGYKKVHYYGAIPADIMIVGEAPGKEEEIEGKPFVGPSGKLLRRALNFSGLGKYKIFIANACKCRINTQEAKKTTLALKHCRPFLEDAIRKVKPKIIVALGAIAMRQLIGVRHGVTRKRGEVEMMVLDDKKYPVFITLHPAHILRNATKGYPNKELKDMSPIERVIFEDFMYLRKIIENDFKVPKIDTTQYKEAEYDDLDYLNEKPVLSVDIETNGLGYGNNVRVLSISFSGDVGKSFVVVLDNASDKIKSKVKEILTNEKIHKIVANRPFDENMWYHKVGYEWKGKVHDVLVMAHLIDENLPQYDLETVVEYFTDLKGIKSVAEGMREKLDEAPKDLLIRYNGVDTDATLRAYQSIVAKLKDDEKLLRYYIKFIRPVQDMFAETSKIGFPLNKMDIEKEEKSLTQLADKLHEEATSLIPKILKLKHEKKGVKLSRSELIIDYLFKSNFGLKLKPVQFTSKKGEPSTSEKHLKEFSHKKFVQILLRWKKANKIITTYFPQLKEAINDDGMIYPNTLLYQTVTGRTVVLNPTIQTIPQRGEFAPYVKRIFKAPKGFVLCARDLAQSELRIIGWLANDPNILGALNKGVDLHTKTAAIVNNVPVEKVTKDMRQKAKAINFGFVYGMQAKSFVRYAKDEYGQEFTLEEAEKIREQFFAKPDGYYMLPVYHRRMIEMARKYGYVRSPLGRKRRLPHIHSSDKYLVAEAERQAINFPVQSFSSDLALIGMFLFHEWLKEMGYDSHILLLWFIHDAIMFLARRGYEIMAHKKLKDIFLKDVPKYVRENFGVNITYPVESDGKIGPNWAEMEELGW